ncbi:MAG TPA: hypothetical protein VMO76_14805 [Candidatus Udaeobacter sp.]|nr:hypothetical protein [Candidatus Udaeobacter sp.]
MLENQENLETYVELLRAVGLLTPTMRSYDMYGMYFAVALDSVVSSRLQEVRDASGSNYWEHDALDIVEKMTPAELAALRERATSRNVFGR